MINTIQNNIRLLWSSNPEFTNGWHTQPDPQKPHDPGAYANIIDVFYIFDEIIKDKTMEGNAINLSKARYVIDISIPTFINETSMSENNINDVINFLLAQYKRIEIHADWVPNTFKSKFCVGNTINLVTESFDYENFTDHVGNKIIIMKLISEESFDNIN
jgi:hypothetical protein